MACVSNILEIPSSPLFSVCLRRCTIMGGRQATLLSESRIRLYVPDQANRITGPAVQGAVNERENPNDRCRRRGGYGNNLSAPAEAAQFVNIGALNSKIKRLETDIENLTAEVKTLKAAKR
jgi:hypothetical protein